MRRYPALLAPLAQVPQLRGVRLQIGTGQLWCTDAPARTDQPGSFFAQPKSPVPATCPAVP